MLTDEDNRLICKACDGDEQALAQLFERHRDRLRKLVLLRLNQLVQSRFDASDVVQDAFVEASRKLSDFGKETKLPFFLWLRKITGEQLIQLHRKHLGTAKRNAHREISLHGSFLPEVSPGFLASQLAGQVTSVDRNLIHVEIQQQLKDILNKMASDDREIIAMRHFEELSVGEIATVLGLTRSGVLKRYTRALKRLREGLGESDLVFM